MSQGMNSGRRRFALAAGGLVALQALAACSTTAVPPTPQPSQGGLFVLLVDMVDPSRFESLLPAHSDWLHKKFEQGVFITSGGLGGPRAFAMFKAPNQAEAEALMADEPLYKNGVAKHQVLLFNPRFINAAFAPVASAAIGSKTTEFAPPLAQGNLFVLLVDFVDQAKFEKLLPTHIPWLRQKYERGVFVGSGGLGDKRAMAIFKAPSPAAAEALFVDEPLLNGGAIAQQVLPFNPRFHSPTFGPVVAGGQSTELPPVR